MSGSRPRKAWERNSRRRRYGVVLLRRRAVGSIGIKMVRGGGGRKLVIDNQRRVGLEVQKQSSKQDGEVSHPGAGQKGERKLQKKGPKRTLQRSTCRSDRGNLLSGSEDGRFVCLNVGPKGNEKRDGAVSWSVSRQPCHRRKRRETVGYLQKREAVGFSKRKGKSPRNKSYFRTSRENLGPWGTLFPRREKINKSLQIRRERVT